MGSCKERTEFPCTPHLLSPTKTPSVVHLSQPWTNWDTTLIAYQGHFLPTGVTWLMLTLITG